MASPSPRRPRCAQPIAGGSARHEGWLRQHPATPRLLRGQDQALLATPRMSHETSGRCPAILTTCRTWHRAFAADHRRHDGCTGATCMKTIRMILSACALGGALAVVSCAHHDEDDAPPPATMSCTRTDQCTDACGGRDCPTVCNTELRECECRCPAATTSDPD
jgi:hypothetical protein